MLRLSEEEIIQRIEANSLFECEIADGSLALKIEAYSPIICTAIHAGHQFRSKLMPLCNLSEEERLYEEDPFTDQFIQAMPITLIGRDSRYEYDLNRPVANCIYSQAWGKAVWRSKLSAKERKISTNKHQTFYRVLDALIRSVEQQYRASLIFDVHSYNHLRQSDDAPTFNIGSEQINMDRWQSIVDFSLKKLGAITLPNSSVTAKENAVFYGRGYMISHVNSRFQNTLVLPLEVKKVFMNEGTGELYPLVMQTLSQQFKHVLVDIAAIFSRRFAVRKLAPPTRILASKIDPAIVKVDRALFKLAKGLESLYYINPINVPKERKQFFKSNGNYLPKFLYRQLDIDPFASRKQLYQLPVEAIRDPSIQSLYRDVIDGLSEKIALLVKAGSSDFLYESLKYYGEPTEIDIQNAHFLLHARGIDQGLESNVSTEDLRQRMQQAAADWHMPCKIETSTKLVASAMVSDRRKAILLANQLQISDLEANALVHHELGVHMATTLNAGSQRLKVFALGLPGNTLTQEGLAILNEYHSGNVSLKRLHGLALRVLAVKQMLTNNDFRHTFSFLHEEHHLSSDEAFKLAVRVHRGGGFTKDYLYLNGVGQALGLYDSEDISNLYVGKTGFQYLPVINEMVERQLISVPKYLPAFLAQPAAVAPELKYLMSCIRTSDRALVA
jgi:uncharacterized protein (TIGR02421 family)